MRDLTEEDFDFLKIEKKEEDHLTWDFIYQGTECHFKSRTGAGWSLQPMRKHWGWLFTRMTEKGKTMKIISKGSAKLLLLLLLAVELLGGCVPKMYSKSQEEALVQSCLPAVKEFLLERYGEYELGELYLQKGIIEPEKALYGRFGSNVVRGRYTVGGNTWDLVYDRETGDFYTGELLEKLRAQEAARMLKYLKEELPEEDLAEFRVTVLDIYYLVQSHDISIDSSTTGDTYVYITNVLPAGISEADLLAFAERGFDGGTVSSIRCHYYSARKNALTDEAFQAFFADNPAYQVSRGLLIDNDNPSAAEESGDGSEAEVQNVQQSSGDKEKTR